MTFLDFLRAFVACYFIFVAVHYTARLAGLRARKNFAHARIGDVREANGQHQIVFRVFRSLILLLMIARVFSPEIDALLVPIRLLEHNLVGAAGMVMMISGQLIVDYCHAYLREEWRSGTASGPADSLVTTGPYSLSRNPIFSGIIIGQLGLMLAAPSLFTVIVAVVGMTVIIRQAAIEEVALGAKFGPEYRVYHDRVPAWTLRAVSNDQFATR